jgi:hypothetical protein
MERTAARPAPTSRPAALVRGSLLALARGSLGALGPAAALTLAAGAGLLGACRRSDAPRPPDAAPPQLAWVDPMRCLKPCTHDPSTTVAWIDDRGARSEAGPLRFDSAAQPSLEAMLAAARAAGHEIAISSAYRTHAEQAKLWSEATDIGRAARPGHSEHELGLAVDLDYPDDGSLDWLLAHAAEHGFVQSYPAGKERITGYRYEPWHYRFMGPAIAREIAARGSSPQEYFRSHPGVGFSGDCSDCAAPTSSSACGALTARGDCVGTVLTWCMDGARAAVDCATSSRRCALRDEATGFDCM